ncbi:hypothetical protein [Dysgonomonas reticulitermitis]
MQNEAKNQGCIPRRPTNGLPAESDERAIAPSLSTPPAPGVSPATGRGRNRNAASVLLLSGFSCAVSFKYGVPIGRKRR